MIGLQVYQYYIVLVIQIVLLSILLSIEPESKLSPWLLALTIGSFVLTV